MGSKFEFDISPEKEASQGQFLRRQLFHTPPAVTRSDADLRGKTAIVTGSNIGIGLECSRQLLDLGLSKLIMAVRDEAKGEAARKSLLAERSLPSDAIEVWLVDLLDYDSIIRFAERASKLEKLDIAVLNAGVYRAYENFVPATGYEFDIQVNYLSTVLLAILLLPTLQAKKPDLPPGRLTLLSTESAAWAVFPERESDPLLPAFKAKMERWDMAERYGTSKLLSQLFVLQLLEHVDASRIVVNMANPGLAYDSRLGRDGDGKLLGLVFRVIARVLGRPSAVAARSVTAAAATFGSEVHGHYVEEGKIRPAAPIMYKDEGKKLAEKLWNETMEEFFFAGVRDVIKRLKSTV